MLLFPFGAFALADVAQDALGGEAIAVSDIRDGDLDLDLLSGAGECGEFVTRRRSLPRL